MPHPSKSDFPRFSLLCCHRTDQSPWRHEAGSCEAACRLDLPADGKPVLAPKDRSQLERGLSFTYRCCRDMSRNSANVANRQYQGKRTYICHTLGPSIPLLIMTRDSVDLPCDQVDRFDWTRQRRSRDCCYSEHMASRIAASLLLARQTIPKKMQDIDKINTQSHYSPGEAASFVQGLEICWGSGPIRSPNGPCGPL